ncbi:hypothetical protein Q2T83_16010 [Fervidibacter sacchari]|uniref:Bacterial surface antigen (D15) domain-containing protein n=1 Tax=Candidatus Fervidibacter sacchari TaxID=1448929 RepID=A0ABT2EKL6_9BACT|nr:hypothetical protein [Candidatus Fervidibacter sacchari]MCS3918011.1 hypothetical protein [Candidatus Fervidibacter sacchari]WKU15825.1 hypothetical protein Q2T83_16010 [Candidatus Fervidibacter sacchari]
MLVSVLALVFRAFILIVIGLFAYPVYSQSLMILRMPTTGLAIVPNATIEEDSLGFINNFSGFNIGYMCLTKKISSKSEIGLFSQGITISSLPSTIQSVGLGGKHKFTRTIAVGFWGFWEDTEGFEGFICHDLFLSPRWKGTLGLLYAKWRNPLKKGDDFLPFLGLLGKVNSRLKVTFEWRAPFEGDLSPTFLSTFNMKIKQNVKIGMGLGKLGAREKLEFFIVVSIGEGDLFAGWLR